MSVIETMPLCLVTVCPHLFFFPYLGNSVQRDSASSWLASCIFLSTYSVRDARFIKSPKRSGKTLILLHVFFFFFFIPPASVAQLDAASDWRSGGRGFNPRRRRQHSFLEFDHEIFSTVILSLPLIQEGQVSVSGERMCTILVNCLED